MIEIKRLDGTTILTLADMPEGALVHRELGGDHYCKFPFTLEEPVYLRLGDYVQLPDFGRFELVDPYSPKYDKETAGYKYELQLDAYYIKWRNKVVRYMPISSASETSFHLTATIDVHLGVIVKGINAIGDKDANFRYEGLEFKFQLFNFPADKVKSAKYKQYNNTDYISALNDLAQIFDCEWWVDGNIIFFGKCKLDGDEIDFELDVNVEEMGGSESKNDYATRIIAFGSDRNLPPDYRKNSSADITQNGVVQKRLMLPLTGEHACPNGYVQDANVYSETEAIEIVIVDDDVYPRTKCKVSKVETYTHTYDDEDTGEKVTKTYYRLYDSSGLNFSTDYILEGETLHIIFQSGKMNGMDFECHYDDKKKYYEVVVNEDYGRELPDTNLHPEVDDEFVLYGWDSTKIGNTGLVEAAEEELYQHIIEKAHDLKIDPNTYNCSMRSDWYQNKMETESFVSWSLGQPVRLLNPTYFQNGRSSRIIGYEIKLDIPYDIPEFIVGEAAAYSRTKDMEQKIDSLTFNGVAYEINGSGGRGVYLITTTSSTPASDYNAYSAKRADRQFLRRDIADTAYGQITHKERSIHEKGVQFGDSFVPGLVGIGGMVDGNGNGELRSLKLWEWLEVPELRYNKVSIYTGIRWDTFGGGIIESITPDADGSATGQGVLKLEEGEYGAIEVGDLCMGIWHDTAGNAEETTDDHRGNFAFAGFKTVYFEITAVSGADNSRFAYTLRSRSDGGNGIHPFAKMHFACRGNISDKARQAFAYTTTEYSLALVDVRTWDFQPSNYSSIHGNIEGFSMPAVNDRGEEYSKVFHGHGQVFGNAYIFGKIDAFERVAYRCFISQSMGGSIAPNEEEEVTVTIFNGYGEDVTAKFTLFSVTRNTGDEASDALWNSRHTNVGNPFIIAFSDLGIDGIRKTVATFFVTASDEGTGEVAKAATATYSI